MAIFNSFVCLPESSPIFVWRLSRCSAKLDLEAPISWTRTSWNHYSLGSFNRSLLNMGRSRWFTHSKCQWFGLREHLPENPRFSHETWRFPVFFPLKSSTNPLKVVDFHHFLMLFVASSLRRVPRRTDFLPAPNWMSLARCMTLSCAAIDAWWMTRTSMRFLYARGFPRNIG